jgi:hypothetical protein
MLAESDFPLRITWLITTITAVSSFSVQNRVEIKVHESNSTRSFSLSPQGSTISIGSTFSCKMARHICITQCAKTAYDQNPFQFDTQRV